MRTITTCSSVSLCWSPLSVSRFGYSACHLLFSQLVISIEAAAMSGNQTFVDEDGSSGSEDDLNLLDGHNKRPAPTPASGCRKRSRKATGDAIVDAMLEIAAASKMRASAILRNEERFAISKCIKVLDEMQDLDQRLYFYALDLFESPNARETFISLKSERRLLWLQGKFSTS